MNPDIRNDFSTVCTGQNTYLSSQKSLEVPQPSYQLSYVRLVQNERNSSEESDNGKTVFPFFTANDVEFKLLIQPISGGPTLDSGSNVFKDACVKLGPGVTVQKTRSSFLVEEP